MGGEFTLVTVIVEIIIVRVFSDTGLHLQKHMDSSSIYDFYVQVAIMMFVGFGYLMTFLNSYGFSAVGLTMFITCVGGQWAVLCEKLMTEGGYPFDIGFEDFLNMNFAVAAVLISFGAVIGKASPLHLLMMTLIELVFYCLNKVYFLQTENFSDCGGTIIIHVFGAYFGLSCAYMFGEAKDNVLNTNTYVADLFSLVGTVFLWLFWPSFVAGGLPAGEQQTMALINTVMALLASTVTAFALTPMYNANLLTTVPIQNATLAGGVSIGATANFAMGPGGAVLVGIIAGAISTIGFSRPLIPSSIDTCGINSLHGMPGIFGGLVSVVIPFIVTNPNSNTPMRQLAIAQAAGLFATFGVAILSGAATGLFLRCFPRAEPFSDATFWNCAPDIIKKDN